MIARLTGTLAEIGADGAVIDVGGVAHPDASTVDAMASFHLIARRFGCGARFRHVSKELQEIVSLMGLTAVLSVETSGEPEQREEMLGVEEETDPGDVTA